MSRKLITALVGAALIAGSAATAGAAEAATPSCGSAGKVCLWEDTDYQTNGSTTGYYAVTTYNSHLGSAHYIGHSNDVVGDSVTSAYNHTSSNVLLFIDASCSGVSVTEGPGWADSNFGNGTPGGGVTNFDDRVSSVTLSAYLATCRAH